MLWVIMSLISDDILKVLSVSLLTISIVFQLQCLIHAPYNIKEFVFFFHFTLANLKTRPAFPYFSSKLFFSMTYTANLSFFP